jgi:hypothetical protein
MSEPAKAKLFAVSEPTDRPIEKLTEGKKGMDVQFNPSSLKVSLSNSLKEDDKGGSTRAAQYVDKSSSSLTVELLFDTTDRIDRKTKGDKASQKRVDVRKLTGAIAEAFMKPVKTKDAKKLVPQRCLFQWGTFGFVGIMESFDETLDFFSSEGTPLRATVSLKLSESRFQFMGKDAADTKQNTPQLSSRGRNTPVNDANKEAGKSEKDWRDTSMFNGVESPRLPAAPALAVPGASAMAGAGASISGGAPASLGASASFGASASLGASISAGASATAGVAVGAGASAGVSGAGFSASASAAAGSGVSVSAAASVTPPSFTFGASASLGTSVSGAFFAGSASAGGLTAGAIVAGGASLRPAAPSLGLRASGGASVSVSARNRRAKASASGKASVGFD